MVDLALLTGDPVHNLCANIQHSERSEEAEDSGLIAELSQRVQYSAAAAAAAAAEDEDEDQLAQSMPSMKRSLKLEIQTLK